MDYRLQKFLHPWIMRRFGADNFDIISLAGGVHDYENGLKVCAVGVAGPFDQTGGFINHEDCRAYGRDGTYKRHKRDLVDAKQKIEAIFSDLAVETFYLHLDGTFVTDIENRSDQCSLPNNSFNLGCAA
jgi:hypothetical protein